MNVTAVDGQMQLTVKSLVRGVDIQHTAVLLAATDIHRHPGVESAVVFVQLLRVLHRRAILAQLHSARLIDARNIRAVDSILCPVRDHHVCSGCRSVDILARCFGIVAPTLIHIIEDHCRRHLTGDIDAIEDQRHNRLRIFLSVLTEIDRDLAARQPTADRIGARPSNVHDRMRRGILCAVGILFRALPIGEILAGFIIHDIVRHIYSVTVVSGYGYAVHRDTVIVQLNVHRVILRHDIRHSPARAQ